MNHYDNTGWIIDMQDVKKLTNTMEKAIVSINKLEAELVIANTTIISHANKIMEQHNTIAYLENQLAAAQERERWIPATEPPIHINRVQICMDEPNGKFISIGWFDTHYWHEEKEGRAYNVIYWRELPELP